jgi:hypothetical protein
MDMPRILLVVVSLLALVGKTSSFSLSASYIARKCSSAAYCKPFPSCSARQSKRPRSWITGVKAARSDLSDVMPIVLQSENGPVDSLPKEWDLPGVYACFNRYTRSPILAHAIFFTTETRYGN